MSKELSEVRKDYGKDQLNLDDLPFDPVELFEKWAKRSPSNMMKLDYNAMTLATIDENNYPQIRIVLLRSIFEGGFVFYTNYLSDKGQNIDKQSNVSLNFFWKELEKQVRIVGEASKVSSEVSDAYFASRPEHLKLEHGQVIKVQRFNPEMYKKGCCTLKRNLKVRKYLDLRIGAATGLSRIQLKFWQGRPSRLHDRVKYIAKGDGWQRSLLSP